MRTSVGCGFLLISVLLGCGDKDHLPADHPPVATFESFQALDQVQLNGGLSSDPDNNPLTLSWSASSPQISISAVDKSTAFFRLPAIALNDSVKITLTVSDGRMQTRTSKSLLVPMMTPSRAFGLGRNVTEEVSNDVPYEWYIDQGHTGTYSLSNCGPASSTMAIHWAQPQSTSTTEQARSRYESQGGWWYTGDLINYLGDNHVTRWAIDYTTQGLKDQLAKGRLVILCLDMYYVTPLTQQPGSEFHKDKFYTASTTGWGHFIVIKGYKVVDGNVFFESYDPYSLDQTYSDGTLKGKSRYYTSTDLEKATRNWWNYALIVSKDGTTDGRYNLDASRIIQMPGR